MAPATEIATIPLTTGAAIEDPSSPAGKVWQATVDTFSQQDGFQRALWGREVENPSLLQLFIDWDSVDDHKKFIASPLYGPFVKHVTTVIDGSVEMYHANFTPHPPTAALGTASPVTEVLTSYLEKQDDGFPAKIDKFIKVLSDNAEGFKASSAGWVIEDVEYKEKKGKAYVTLLGWESVEAHMKFRETQAFKDHAHLIREDPLGLEVHHTIFVEK